MEEKLSVADGVGVSPNTGVWVKVGCSVSTVSVGVELASGVAVSVGVSVNKPSVGVNNAVNVALGVSVGVSWGESVLSGEEVELGVGCWGEGLTLGVSSSVGSPVAV